MLGTKLLLLLSLVVYVSSEQVSYYGSSNVRNQSPPRPLGSYRHPNNVEPISPIYNLRQLNPTPQPTSRLQPVYQPPQAVQPQPPYSPAQRPHTNIPMYDPEHSSPAPVPAQFYPQGVYPPIPPQPANTLQPNTRPINSYPRPLRPRTWRPVQTTEAPAEVTAEEIPSAPGNTQIVYPEPPSSSAAPSYATRAVNLEPSSLPAAIEEPAVVLQPLEKGLSPSSSEVTSPSDVINPQPDLPKPSEPESIPEVVPSPIPEEPLTDPIPDLEQPLQEPIPNSKPDTPRPELEPELSQPELPNYTFKEPLEPVTAAPAYPSPSVPNYQPMQPPRPNYQPRPPNTARPLPRPQPPALIYPIPVEPPKPLPTLEPLQPDYQPLQPPAPIQPIPVEPSPPQPLPTPQPPPAEFKPLQPPTPIYPIPVEPRPPQPLPIPQPPQPDYQPLQPPSPIYPIPVEPIPPQPLPTPQPPQPDYQPLQPPVPIYPIPVEPRPPQPLPTAQPPQPDYEPLQPPVPIYPIPVEPRPPQPLPTPQPPQPDYQPLQPPVPIYPIPVEPRPPQPLPTAQPSQPDYQPLQPPVSIYPMPVEPRPPQPLPTPQPPAPTPSYQTLTPSASLPTPAMPEYSTSAPSQPPPQPIKPYPIKPPTSYEPAPVPDVLPVIPMSEFQCKKGNGYYTIINECDAYIECQSQKAWKHTCPDGLHFNPGALYPEYPCAYPSQVQCESTASKQIPKPTNECPNRYGFFSISGGDCSNYIMCQEGKATLMNCPFGLVFNDQLSSCDWPENVPQCNPNAFKDFACPLPPEDDPDLLTRYRYGTECGRYVACQRGHPRLLRCDSGLSFDDDSQVCIDTDLVPQCRISTQ